MTQAQSPATPVRVHAEQPGTNEVWGGLRPPPPGSLDVGPSTPSYVPAAPAPFDTSAGLPSVTDPDLSDAWGATHLAAPPSGSLSVQETPWREVSPGWTPSEALPTAPTAFSPPEERGSLPGASVPAPVAPQLDVPKPIRGIPIDQPAAGRFEAPEDEAPKTKPKLTRTMVLAAAVVVVLAGVLSYLVIQRNNTVTIDSAISLPSSAEPSAPKVARGDLAVKGYLEALRDGQLETALSYGPIGGGSRALLVPEALKVSLAAAPITNINVTPADLATSTIHASYQLGSQAVVTDFKTKKRDDGNWQLESSTTTVRLEAKRSDRVPLIINGQKIGPVVELELVPGTYTMSTGLPFIEYQATTKITVNVLTYNKTIAELPLDVTAEGKAALTSATQTSLENCLDYKQLSPPNCPMRESSSKPLNNVTITRRLNVQDPVSGAQWVVDKDDPAVAQAVIQVSYTFSASYADGSGSTDGTPFNKQWTARTDATKTRAQDLQVLWG